jgi:hypothetical protein
MTVHQVMRRQDVVTTQGVAEFGFPLPTGEGTESRGADAHAQEG